MLFTFPSQYSFTIGLTGVFSLTGWSRLIHAEFLVLRATQDTAMPCFASYTGLSPPMVVLSRTFYSQNTYNIAVLLPRRCRNNDGLGSSAFARHYSQNRFFFLFLQVLRCFSSLRLPHYLGSDNWPSASWVVPFGNPRIKDYLHLPEAYRSLSRPSSPPRAKASTRRPNFLSPIYLH